MSGFLTGNLSRVVRQIVHANRYQSWLHPLISFQVDWVLDFLLVSFVHL